MGVNVKFHKGAWWIFVNHRGRRRAKKVGDRDTALAVARKIRQRLAEGDLKLLESDPDGPTLETYATRWLEDGQAARKGSSHRFYSFNLTLHILPALGAKGVSALKRADCRELMVAPRA